MKKRQKKLWKTGYESRNTDVLLYSDFNRDETEKMGFKKIEDIQEYVDHRISQNGKIKITIVPTGRFVRLRK
ncbi:unnamed protein product [marine sediment metagenome]|uniref:Uncharacterized protein n=1 Tax=marine sediment metagenome TaxID=412755 RepID=X1H606_9ZZZZ